MNCKPTENCFLTTYHPSFMAAWSVPVHCGTLQSACNVPVCTIRWKVQQHLTNYTGMNPSPSVWSFTDTNFSCHGGFPENAWGQRLSRILQCFPTLSCTSCPTIIFDNSGKTISRLPLGCSSFRWSIAAPHFLVIYGLSVGILVMVWEPVHR